MGVSEDKGTKENSMLTLAVSMCALATVLNFLFELTFTPNLKKKKNVKIKQN